MDNIKKEKIAVWNKKLGELETQLQVVMQQKGEAAAMGDLSENAAYKMALEEAETLRVRISEIQKIISKLENN
ncbi:hypothetical protein HYS93_01735 [Candidatus Daviesbacteria bacterium]|nr:hypothetical protein [Candidatus Daviesbacteria bacterium]